MPQGELPIVGATSPAITLHPKSEIAACRSIADAIYRAMLHAHMTQEALASRLGISESYLSLILCGKRKASAPLVQRVARVTGSAAPMQWLCASLGGEFYIDRVEARRAALLAELHDLEAKEAA